MNIEERIIYYLGDCKDVPHSDMNKYKLNDLTSGVNAHDNNYDTPIKNLIIKHNFQDKRFCFTRGDVISENEQHQWTLSKNRCENNTCSVILRSLNFNRHWLNYYKKSNDIQFKNKISKIFWRGTTTGCSQHFSATNWSPRKINRFSLMEKWFNSHEDIDIGFSFIHREWLKAEYNKYVKGLVHITTFLKYKYILSIEGNDKDSGLNWKLNSNSVILMPKPRVTSWLMETTLIPNYHYVLIKDDFSDLLDKLEWCNKNQSKCIEIVTNANTFMSQFKDNMLENEIETEVFKRYFILKDKLLN